MKVVLHLSNHAITEEIIDAIGVDTSDLFES